MSEEIMSKSRIVIAAEKSGCGKTTVTLGLLNALKKRGISVSSFKCGPDYIDPLFHREVLNIPSGNLDTFFTDGKITREIFLSEAEGDISVIEGVMGLYDGIGGTEECGSTYDLAKTLCAPVILVLDAKGVGRSLAASLSGFLSYDRKRLIKGFVLNRVSASYGKKLGEYMEKELGVSFLGALPFDETIIINSRHLGLLTPDAIEKEELKNKLEGLGELFEKNIDIERMIEIAKGNGEIRSTITYPNPKKTVKLAVARDRAFSFYYRENLRMLETYGAELLYFSPINDNHLPDGIGGLILGGGYPEGDLDALSKNTEMLCDIRKKIEGGLPVIAECGGFMYLLDEIEDNEKRSFPMAGVIKGKAFYSPKDAKKRFGYIIVDRGKGRRMRGHEFHYFDSDNNGTDAIAKKPDGSKEWLCMHIKDNIIAGFPHLYYPSDPEFALDFIKKAKDYQGRRNDL